MVRSPSPNMHDDRTPAESSHREPADTKNSQDNPALSPHIAESSHSPRRLPKLGDAAAATAVVISLLALFQSCSASREANDLSRQTVTIAQTQVAGDRPNPTAEFVAHVGSPPRADACLLPDGSIQLGYVLLEYYLVQNSGARPVALLGVDLGPIDAIPIIEDYEIRASTRAEYFGDEGTFLQRVDTRQWDYAQTQISWNFRPPPFAVPAGEPISLLLERVVVITTIPKPDFQGALRQLFSQTYTDEVIFSFGDGSEERVTVSLESLGFPYWQSLIDSLDPSATDYCHGF